MDNSAEQDRQNIGTGEARVFPASYPIPFLLAVSLIWVLIYTHLHEFSAALVSLWPLGQGTHLVETLRFFIYEAPKVLMLLVAVVMVMGMINSWFTPERTRAMLAGRHEGLGNIMAASLGIVTPFCSCSAVPLFIGFVQAGVPLGVTFSFLIAAPMINEIALTLLFALVGWKIALLYLTLGLSVAIVAGWIIGRFSMERYLEDWVRDMARVDPHFQSARLSMADRLQAGLQAVKDIVGRVWVYIVIGVAIGAGIHGYVPQEFMISLMGKDASWWSVPAAIIMGVPMYSNAAGIIPVVEALLAKGAALGTVLAFMMSVIALSFPEMVILRKVLKLPLIAVFVGTIFAGILFVSMIFNAVL
ncbi:MAG: permease [Gammaproteobacteria bacterium]|nr:MAG: permease [Gammaproteobacteria bacterium]